MKPGGIYIKPRILFLDRFYFPDEQATSIYLTELINALSARFHIEVLCGPPAVVTDQKNFSSSASRIYEAPCLTLPKRILFARFLNDLSFLFSALVRGLFLQKPVLLVSQTSPPGVWWIGFILSRWYGSGWIHVSNDIFPDNFGVLSGLQKSKLFNGLSRFILYPLKKSNRIIVIGHDMKEKLAAKGINPEKIYKSHHWTDLNFIKPLPKKNNFGKKYGLEGKFVVLYAGNFSRIHNFEDLLDTAEDLKDYGEILFLLVGEGALKEKLIEESRRRNLKNILFAPFEPRSRLPEVLAVADASVILLRRGMAGLSVPSKIYSILASGRPVLALVDEESDIARIVRESNAGFVFPPGNPSKSAEAILKLSEEPSLGIRLGSNARNYMEEKNFQAAAFRDTENIFEETINGKKNI